ncbi:MAG: hypothetical protein HYX24_00550 [Candidatus Aenigmarchaeota archaeon]|nr:hypothetical protein [Candidatus Aenigmarchaeota archaeon]
MAKKGMALEMVVMMIILLVVAAVIIQIFLANLGGESIDLIANKGKCEGSRQEFISRCNSLCDSYKNSRAGDKAVDFCGTYLGQEDRNVQVDWNCDKKANEAVEVGFGSFKLPVCENMVYCFMAVSCQNLGAAGCREALCQSNTELYRGDTGKASEAVAESVQTGEKENFGCRLPDEEVKNWYLRYGFASGRGSGKGEYSRGNICS